VCATEVPQANRRLFVLEGHNFTHVMPPNFRAISKPNITNHEFRQEIGLTLRAIILQKRKMD
jgi:hypothetical protein